MSYSGEDQVNMTRLELREKTGKMKSLKVSHPLSSRELLAT